MDEIKEMKPLLEKIYGKKKGGLAFNKIVPLIERSSVKKNKAAGYFSQEDVILITYGDSLYGQGEAPLNTLCDFAERYFKDIFSTIHLLPFYPFSSDDGFSVCDYYTVNSALGTWNDIRALGDNFRLMFDFVLNHISAKSDWFDQYLKEAKEFEALAIEVDPLTDLAAVTRPRSLPLLTEVKKYSGTTAHVWTTFSADQIDLNFKSIDVLEKMIEVLLFYVRHGATILRLDAIAYLWKEIGTNCIHLQQTHDIVKLFRKILDLAAPEVMILTETNVPHEENISYFGDGQNEAQMVYNFTLPPLLLYSFVKEDATILSEWAKGLRLRSEKNTFFNFTASHDGIGVRPLEGILSKKEIDQLVEKVKENGGDVSYKKNPDGSESPYELNITYVDAFLNKSIEADPDHPRRFLASQAIQFVLPGVPATYIHSILGSRNWEEGVTLTQRARTINREKLQSDAVLSQLQDPESFRFQIFFPYIEMITIRKKQKAFHPNAFFEVLNVDPRIFAIKRYCKDQQIVALINVSSTPVSIPLSGKAPSDMQDLISGKTVTTGKIRLNPYQFMWLSDTNTW